MSQNQNNTAVLLILSGCAIGALAGYMRLASHHTNLASEAPPPKVIVGPALTGIQKQMNEELKETAIQTELQREATKEDNAGSDAISNRDFDEPVSPKPIPFVLQQQNNFPKNSQKETAQNYSMTPSERISLMLKQNERIQNYNRRYRREFVQQFLKNAHDHGVDVQLNKNLDVTGLSIDTSNRPLLFPSSEVQSSSRK